MEQTKKYIQLYEKFYQIVEMSHLETIKLIFDVPIRLKDIHLVFKVAEMTEANNNFSTKIAEATRMSRSIFSNYLIYAEKMKLIKRYRDPESYKNMRIELDVLGIQVYEAVMEYYHALYDHLRSTNKSTDLLLTIQAIYKTSNLLSFERPQFKTNVLTMSKSLDTLTKAFDRVFFYMHDQELQFIRDYDLNLSIIDLRVLSFIDMLSLTKHNQPKYITEKSRIHFSTISSMLKVLEKKDYILRKQNQEDKRAFDIFLTKMAKNIVNDYMTLRMTIHDNIQNHLSKKAYTQIVYAFENLQTFTESYAQRFKT